MVGTRAMKWNAAIRTLSIVVLSVFTQMASAQWQVDRVAVEGLAHVPTATVEKVIADEHVVDLASMDAAVKALYATGFFSHAVLNFDQGVLHVKLTEKPIIKSISYSGNHHVTDAQMDQMLKAFHLTAGQVYSPAQVEQVRHELEHFYHDSAYLHAQVDVKTTEEAHQTVVVHITVNEDQRTRVSQITVQGHRGISRWKTLKLFGITGARPWSWVTGGNLYDQASTDKGKEAITAYYTDHGYFQAQVAVDVVNTADHRVDLNIKIQPGDHYTFGDIQWQVDGLISADELKPLVGFAATEGFSQQAVDRLKKKVHDYLTAKGFAYPFVDYELQANPQNKTVAVTLQVKSGLPYTVRQIRFIGHHTTADHVFRHPLKQFEQAPFDLAKIEESKRRIANYAFVEEVDYQLHPVEGQANLLDIDFYIKERLASTVTLSAGYSSVEKFIIGLTYDQKNVFGMGSDMTIGLNRSASTDTFSVEVFDPFIGYSNISQSSGVYLEKFKADKISMSSYTNNSEGIHTRYGIPIKDHQTVFAGMSLAHSKYSVSDTTDETITDFIDTYGDSFIDDKLSLTWQYANYDRAWFPRHGLRIKTAYDINLPIFDRAMHYYRTSVDLGYYHTLFYYKDVPAIFNLVSYLGYTDSYGDSFRSALPFYSHYYAGGIGSVRGYAANSLGPKDEEGHAIGGQWVNYYNFNFILPVDLPSARLMAFYDIGNVYVDHVDLHDVFTSYGLSLQWLSPVGALTFSYGIPSHKGSGGYERESFQFDLGMSF